MQHRAPQGPLSHPPPLGIAGTAAKADHPLYRRGPKGFEPLPTGDFNFRQSLQQGLKVKGVADGSGFESRRQFRIVNGKALSLYCQGQQRESRWMFWIDLPA
jgi:hypothetical protein